MPVSSILIKQALLKGVTLPSASNPVSEPINEPVNQSAVAADQYFSGNVPLSGVVSNSVVQPVAQPGFFDTYKWYLIGGVVVVAIGIIIYKRNH